MARQQWMGVAAAAMALLHSSCAFVAPCHRAALAKTAGTCNHSSSRRRPLFMNDVLLTPPDRTGLVDSLDDVVNFDGQMPFPSDLPRPPFEFQVPGEQGNPTLCTDPDWTAAMLALDFLGLPYTVVNGGQDCAAPQLEMADEVYDDTHALTAMLEERYVLSDLVQTVDGVLRRVRALRTALETLLLAKEPPAEAAATAELAAELGRVEFRLKSRRDGGDFLEGDELTYGDLELGVTLHHLRAALPHFRPAWAWPEACELLRAYADAMTGMQVFAEVAPPAEAIVARYEALGAVVKAK